MRRLLPLPVALFLILGLSACGGDPTPDPVSSGSRGGEIPTCAESGSVSDAVDVTGELGAEPTVFFESPLEVDATQRTVAIEGDGDEVEFGDTLSISFTVYNGETGEVSSATSYGETGSILAIADPQQLLPGIAATLLCTSAGSRVVGVVTPEDAFGSEGYPDLGIGPDATLVIVIDIVHIVGSQAEGEPQDLPADFPALGLEFAEDGRPTLVIPDADPPTALRIGLLIKGDGPVVGQEDEFTIQYQGTNWTTREIFDETWGDAPRALSSVIPGFKKAIVGQTVGSRVVVVVPPAEGYGEAGNENAGIGGTDTIVFVIDILATTPPF